MTRTVYASGVPTTGSGRVSGTGTMPQGNPHGAWGTARRSAFLALEQVRRTGRLLVMVITVTAVTLAMDSATVARAYPFDPRGEDWEGLSQLVQMAQAELGPTHVVVTSRLDLRALRKEDGLLIVHPERPLDVDELSAFMRSGGRLVLLDDYGEGDGLLARFGIQRVPLPTRPAEMLRGNPSFAIAEPASAHPAVRDVSRLVTNHGTGLEHAALSPVLVVRGDGEPDVLLGLAGAVGQGRLLAIGDASLGINSMLRYPGNRALCASLVRYLTDDDVWGKRGGTLYVLANDFETTGSYGDDSRLGGAAGDLRRTLFDALEVLRNDGMPPLAAYLVALGLGLGIVLWTSARAGRPHRSVVPRFVRRVPAVAHGGVAGHAAIIASPGTSRVLAMLELKSCLEEDLATRLGMDRPPPHDILVARARSAGLVDATQADELTHLLARFARIEASLLTRQRSAADRVRDADVLRMAARMRNLLDAMGSAAAVVHSKEPS
ncbi:MAG TPA: DUF4350 domain-containing protein [Polyangiaceae bacterium]